MPKLAEDQFTLGRLIAALENRPPAQDVVFDFCEFRPARIDSYRGFYEDLALGFTTERQHTVATLLTKLRAAVGETFYGYKGGEYAMSLETALWVAEWGNTSDTIVVGVDGNDYQTVLHTRWIAKNW